MQQKSDTSVKKTIYLIRHGQTDFNKRGIVQGSGVDSSLNEEGNQQALKFYAAYNDIPFSDIYVSSLKRTHQTVAPFAAKQIPMHVLKELDEINWGILEGAEPTEENTAEFLRILGLWKSGELEVAIEGGETPNSMYARQKIGLEKIESSQSGNTVLVCMHGRAMRSFLCLLTQIPLQNMDEFEHGNTCLYILEKEENATKYDIIERNLRTHLHSDLL